MEEKRFSAIFGSSRRDLSAMRLSTPLLQGVRTNDMESLKRKMWRGRWILLWAAVAFSLLAMMLSTLQTPLYREQTSIEILLADRTSLSSKPDEQDTGGSPESFIQTQIRIIESRSLLERVLSRLNDAERARLLETPRFWWTRPSYDQSLELIRRNITSHPSDQAGIIDISFLSPDALTGAHFLNVLTQELEDFNIERSWRLAQRNRQWAERQIDELRRKWEQSEQLVEEATHGAAIKPVASTSRKPAVRQQLPQSRRTSIANDAELHQLRRKLANLNQQISEWEALYGSSSATVQNLKAEASATEAAVGQRQTARRQSSPTASMDAKLTSLAPLAQPPGRGLSTAHLEALKESSEANRILYETTAARLKDVTLASPSSVSNISVVDPAIPVSISTTPSKFLTGLLGALTGFLAGLGFIAIRHRFSNTFSEPAVLGHYLGVPVLGAIPSDRYARQEKNYDSNSQEPDLRLKFDADVATAEAFRSIRSSILLGTSHDSGPRRLVFTSASSAEGKTFVVGNLGAALASAQRRVLLVDGNLRDPGLHKIFGADNNVGLADLLMRQITETPITTREVIRETQIPDLYLLTAGQAGNRAPEILSSAQLPQLIREFARGFDLVLLDSSPVLPYADARSLALAADAVILVVKAGSTDRHAAILARDAISQDGAPIFGTILTEWEAAQSAFA